MPDNEIEVTEMDASELTGPNAQAIARGADDVGRLLWLNPKDAEAVQKAMQTVPFGVMALACRHGNSPRGAKTFNSWSKTYGMPRNNDKTFNIFEFLPWIITIAFSNIDLSGEEFDPEQLEKLMEEGADGDNLNRFRGFRADMAEIELAKMRGKVIDRAHTETFLASFAVNMRGAIERLERTFGVEARIILEETIDACQKDVDEFFKDIDSTKGKGKK